MEECFVFTHRDNFKALKVRDLKLTYVSQLCDLKNRTILFDSSVLKMYLLKTQLNFHIKSFNYFCFFICFMKQFVRSI